MDPSGSPDVEDLTETHVSDDLTVNQSLGCDGLMFQCVSVGPPALDETLGPRE